MGSAAIVIEAGHAFGEEDRPILEMGLLQDVFVNGIASVDLLSGDCIRITYYVDGPCGPDRQPKDKRAVLALVMPVSDVARARAYLHQRLLDFGLLADGRKVPRA